MQAIREVPVDVWHADEERWWNTHGPYMTYQWQLTPRMTAAIRGPLEEDYKAYLAEPNGTLLDIGCGSGWLSVYFAERGMTVLGIDVSQEQIAAANAEKARRGLSLVEFECADFANWNIETHRGRYSRVFVSAFLHHLPPSELQEAIRKIAMVARPGARIYFYEPLQKVEARSLGIKGVDRIYSAFIGLLVKTLPNALGWWSDRHISELRRGYTMNSPHEAPVKFDVLQEAAGSDFEWLEVRGWHLNSIGLAMQSMGMKEGIRSWYEPLVALSYKLDQFLMKRFGWQAFSTPGRFILCGIKLIRR